MKPVRGSIGGLAASPAEKAVRDAGGPADLRPGARYRPVLDTCRAAVASSILFSQQTIRASPVSVLQLIREIRQKVPVDAAFGTRWQLTARVDVTGASHQLTVAARIDHKGRRREQFLCDGVRVEKPMLLRLTCAETECPHARAVRQQWDQYHRRAPARRAVQLQPLPLPLIEEYELVVNDQPYTARPARFSCYTPCPNRAHPSMVIEKTGYDLFAHDTCVAGGLVDCDGVKRPRLPTLQAAEAFVRSGHQQALMLLTRLRRPHPQAPM